jgi:hypothetical protein
MKKIICLVFILPVIISCFTGCAKAKENSVSWPLKEVNIVYDSYGNILQQVLYNEETKEYFVKDYRWSNQDGMWVCVDQQTTVIKNKDKCNEHDRVVEDTINVYYKSYLDNGPIVVLDNSCVRISIVEYLDKASWWEFGYKIKVENKSSKIIAVMFDEASIMDINCAPLFSIDHIEGGHTAYFNLAWDVDSLERAWIPYLDNVEFMIRVYNSSICNTPALYGTKVLIKH